MKTLALILALTSLSSFAAEIKGTLMLKGTAKTKVVVNGIESKCHVKVDEVKNSMTEDSFGNPAYRVWTKIELSGTNQDRTVRVEHKAEVRFVNIHPTGKFTQVSDSDYVGENEPKAKLVIDEKGRIRTAVFPVGATTVTCTF